MRLTGHRLMRNIARMLARNSPRGVQTSVV
jgi:hypothetical protein